MPHTTTRNARALPRSGAAIGLLLLVVSGLAAGGLLPHGADASDEAPGLRVASDDFSVSVVESREMAHPLLPDLTIRQFVLEVRDESLGRTTRVVWGDPDKRIRDDLSELVLHGDRLVLISRLGFGVLSLRTGEELAFTRSLRATPSPDGGTVAYKTLVPRGVQAEATGDVLLLFDVDTLARRVVFPETDLVSEGPEGAILVTQPDPAARYQIPGDLYWSPDGQRLAFFAKTGATGPASPVRDFVGTVDLSSGAHDARATLTEIPPESYLRADAEVGDHRILFQVDSAQWRDGSLEVHLPKSHWWALESVVIDLP